jgi:hypothetical protein
MADANAQAFAFRMRDGKSGPIVEYYNALVTQEKLVPQMGRG